MPLKKWGEHALPTFLLFTTYGLIFTPKVSTTTPAGVSVPILALIVPVKPFAGAVIDAAGIAVIPIGLLIVPAAAAVLLYVVAAGVLSLITKPVTTALPLLVAVMR